MVSTVADHGLFCQSFTRLHGAGRHQDTTRPWSRQPEGERYDDRVFLPGDLARHNERYKPDTDSLPGVLTRHLTRHHKHHHGGDIGPRRNSPQSSPCLQGSQGAILSLSDPVRVRGGGQHLDKHLPRLGRPSSPPGETVGYCQYKAACHNLLREDQILY